MSYVATGSEQRLFEQAFGQRTPLLLLGPTGCGKTLLIEAMAETLARPLVTVTCHDDLTVADLVGRHLIRGGDVEWQDGPLTTAMRDGAILYLDEIVEARPDTLAMLHSVADHRRTLYVERLGEAVTAPDGFMLVASYNPRPAGSPKELKASLRQRFVTLTLGYLPAEQEAGVVAARTGVEGSTARRLVDVAGLLREAADRDQHARFDPPSTRTLVSAAGLIAAGAGFDEAVDACVLGPLTSEPQTAVALAEIVASRG
jgi:MoxR-like ATPase